MKILLIFFSFKIQSLRWLRGPNHDVAGEIQSLEKSKESTKENGESQTIDVSKCSSAKMVGIL